jgi:RNA polymerase sigma-70 factor (family 1)
MVRFMLHMPENEDIKRLLAAVSLNNDQSAYRELFIRLHNRLKQFAWSIVRSSEEAEEIVSDIFIRIWQNRQQLVTIDSPLLYFYTSIKNQALNQLRKNKRQQNLQTEAWLVQMNSIIFNPEQLLLTSEMLRQIQKAVNDLPPRCRLVFKLIKESGLSYRETSTLLDLSVKTIEAQMAIALRRIAKCMQLEVKRPVFLTSSVKK